MPGMRMEYNTFVASLAAQATHKLDNLWTWYHEPNGDEWAVIRKMDELKLLKIKKHLRPRKRLFYAYQNFLHTPPQYEHGPKALRQPMEPYPGAPGWQRSVYYYWWAYLRENEEYLETCNRKGKGSLADLYNDFEDVRSDDFHQWWWKHLDLFADTGWTQQFEDEIGAVGDPETIALAIPIAYSVKTMAAEAERQVRAKAPEKQERLNSLIRYMPASRPVLRSLHETLEVWKARKRCPSLADADLADVAGLRIAIDERDDPEGRGYDSARIAAMKSEGVSVDDLEKLLRRKKQLVVQRHLRLAQQYIENVGKGEFPKRDRR